MNAVEHIVECYFRLCKKCFTMTDVKVVGGINRQLDLLAYSKIEKIQYHVESSVSLSLQWAPGEEGFRTYFDTKFRGIPEERPGKKTDSAKGKVYDEHIYQTYRIMGLDPSKIRRIFVVWTAKKAVDLKKFLTQYEKDYGVSVNILGFRDEILPELIETVSTSNYDDEILRMISLMKECDKQTKNIQKIFNKQAKNK